MTEYRVERIVVTTYRADTVALADEYPEEYADWLARGGERDLDWLTECIEAGGFDLLSQIDADEEHSILRVVS